MNLQRQINQARQSESTPLLAQEIADEEHGRDHSEEDEEEHEEEAKVHALMALASLVLTTVVIAISAELLVDSLEGLSEQLNVSKAFIGVIILPIVGNAAGNLRSISL